MGLSPLDPLSRLKGIETHELWCKIDELQNFGYTFPFEGNWNASPVSRRWCCHCFGSTFPFEGNWNSSFCFSWTLALPSLDPLSRLKGIETRLNVDSTGFRCRVPLDTLSRLKGIETYISSSTLLLYIYLWIHFPVWRELKPSNTPLVTGVFQILFGYTFPFEGNWNFL